MTTRTLPYLMSGALVNHLRRDHPDVNYRQLDNAGLRAAHADAHSQLYQDHDHTAPDFVVSIVRESYPQVHWAVVCTCGGTTWATSHDGPDCPKLAHYKAQHEAHHRARGELSDG